MLLPASSRETTGRLTPRRRPLGGGRVGERAGTLAPDAIGVSRRATHQGSLNEKKWELLSVKGAAADLALGGRLMDERREPISLERGSYSRTSRPRASSEGGVSRATGTRTLFACWESGAWRIVAV